MTETDINQLIYLFSVQNSDTVDQSAIQEKISSYLESTQTLLLDLSLALIGSLDSTVIQTCLFTFKSNIYYKWQGEGFHSEIRENLLTFLFSGNENITENVYDLAAECLAKVAVFSIMDEWQEFWSVCFIDETIPPIVAAEKLNLATKFCKEVDQCPYLIINTKNAIKELNMSNTEQFFESVGLGLQNPIVVPYALKGLNTIFSWANLSEILSQELMEQICLEYFAQLSTYSAALDCLTTIFIKRTDCLSSFRQYSALVVHSLSTTMDPTNPNLPITSNKDVTEFLMKFLNKFITVIDTLFFPPPSTLDADIQEQISQEAQLIASGLEQYDMTKDQFAECLHALYRVTLSIDPENVTPAFWKLWNDITRKMYFESVPNGTLQNRDEPPPRPITEFFTDMFEFIRIQIFQMLPKAIDDEGTCSFDARSCWAMILQIDPDSMIEFMSQQEPSESLFYAAGCLEFAIQDPTKTDDIFKDIISCIDTIDDSDVSDEFVIALLFGASHCTTYLSMSREDLIRVVMFTLSCLQKDTKVAVAASHTLFYLVKRQMQQFLENNLEIARLVIENSEEFLENLPSDTKPRIFNVCTSIILKADSPEEISSSLEALFQPVIDQIAAFYETPSDRDNIENCTEAFNIISETVASLEDNHSIMCELFAPILIEVGPHVYGNNDFYDVSNALLCALAYLMSSARWDEIQELFTSTLEALVGQREGVSSVFAFVQVVRSKHPPVDDMYSDIRESFIDPALGLDDPPLQSILLMLKEFSLAKVDLDFVKELFMQGVQDFNHEVNEAAFQCWRMLLSSVKDTDKLREVLLSTSEDVLGITLTALTDMLHGSAYERIVEFLKFMFNALSKANIDDDGFITMVCQLLTQIVGDEPRQGMYQEFVTYIKRNANSPNRFIRAINDFLSCMHKMSPLDTDLFKIEEFSRYSFLPYSRPMQSSMQAPIVTSISKQIQDEGFVLVPAPVESLAKKSFHVIRKQFK